MFLIVRNANGDDNVLNLAGLWLSVRRDAVGASDIYRSRGAPSGHHLQSSSAHQIFCLLARAMLSFSVLVILDSEGSPTPRNVARVPGVSFLVIHLFATRVAARRLLIGALYDMILSVSPQSCRIIPRVVTRLGHGLEKQDRRILSESPVVSSGSASIWQHSGRRSSRAGRGTWCRPQRASSAPPPGSSSAPLREASSALFLRHLCDAVRRGLELHLLGLLTLREKLLDLLLLFRWLRRVRSGNLDHILRGTVDLQGAGPACETDEHARIRRNRRRSLQALGTDTHAGPHGFTNEQWTRFCHECRGRKGLANRNGNGQGYMIQRKHTRSHKCARTHTHTTLSDKSGGFTPSRKPVESDSDGS